MAKNINPELLKGIVNYCRKHKLKIWNVDETNGEHEFTVIRPGKGEKFSLHFGFGLKVSGITDEFYSFTVNNNVFFLKVYG